MGDGSGDTGDGTAADTGARDRMAEATAEARAAVQPAMHAAVRRLDARNRRIVEYHLGYADAAGAPAPGDGGKFVRGTLAVLSARAVRCPVAVAVPVAAAVELTHQFSLLHDDIIDHDDMRRHRPSAWRVFGTAEALNAGDALAALAAETALTGPGADAGATVAAARALAGATRRMLAGQAADVALSAAPSVDVDACRQMVADKTGALMECAASIGAIAAGGDAEAIESLAGIGRHLGMAFQVIDDLIGLFGAADRIGKPVGSDLLERKKSLPVVAALSAGGAPAERLAALYAQDGELSPDDCAVGMAAIEAAGGRAWADAEAHRETASALEAIDAAPIDPAAAATLRAIATRLGHRRF